MAGSPLTASLAALSRFFVGDGNVGQTLDRVTHLSIEHDILVTALNDRFVDLGGDHPLASWRQLGS